MRIDAVDEYNADGHLIYSSNYIGAFVRGKTKDEALKKFPAEVSRYCKWLGLPLDVFDCEISVVQEKQSGLQICDADSDVLFDTEIPPLDFEEYRKLKAITLKSANDFLTMYRSINIKDKTCLPRRKTFYGFIPVTADEMYIHTKNVNSYYFGEIHVDVKNEPDILTCRKDAFEILERHPDFLNNTVFDGSYGESWSLRKVCRRFIWHDRIHARAMFRTASKLCGNDNIVNPFFFDI